MNRLHLAAVLLVAAAVSPAGAAEAPADSLAATTTTILPAVTVSGQQAELPGPDQTRLEAPLIALQDPGSLADLGGLIPSARVATNSRGEAGLMIRGAPERHVQTFLDGIPLNLPWDERVDLQTIPFLGTGRIEATRGLTTLLDGPGVLAGSVAIVPPGGALDGPRSRVAVMAGDHVLGRTDLQHRTRVRGWDLLAAGGWQGRNAVTLPKGTVERGGSDRRRNSDLSQYSFLARGTRAVGQGGRLKLLVTHWDAEKGAPAELHLAAAEARFWRYPKRARTLLGAALDLPLDAGGRWDLSTTVSADFFDQEIDPRGPDHWDTPRTAGQDYEKNWDRTGYTRVRATRWLGATTQVSVQTTGRYTHHREILSVGGPTAAYSQWLWSAVAEAEFHPAGAWQVRLGAGADFSATPETGPQPGNSPQEHPTWNARLTRPLGASAELHAAASQRSRAPSLRELYSGALGRFVPNPDLGPETQHLYEVGYTQVAPRWRLEAAAFLLNLTDGIERLGLPGTNQYQRVNRTEIRVPGLELAGGWRPAGELEVSLQHTVLAARVHSDGGFDQAAEDRPDYLSRAGLRWAPATGPGAVFEAVVTGGRWSADATSSDGLRRLPAGVTWNARLSWAFVRPAGGLDLHARLDNVLNQRVDDQVGLPQAGRTVSGGVAVQF